MFNTKSNRILAILTVCFAFASNSLAQTATGRIGGTVNDAQGAAVPGATITVTGTGTGLSRTATTDSEGKFIVERLPIGAYDVSAEHAGFSKLKVPNQRVEIDRTTFIPLQLEVGQVNEIVTVDSAATGVEVMNATIGYTVTSHSIEQIPLNGRNVLNLALLQPGVTESRPNSSAAGTFSISGNRTDSVTYLLDGGLNNDLLSNGVVYNPNPEVVQEFRILSNNYSAEYGRNAGGIVSVVTKSGTNEFHGSAYDFVRNEALNANRFFDNKLGRSKPILKRHQFGGHVSGPVVRDKVFFLFGYQGQLQNELSTGRVVPAFTPAQLTGNFSQSGPGGGPDPDVAAFLSKHPYFQPNPDLAARAIIDPSRINTIARNYIAAGIIPTSPTGEQFPRGASNDDRQEYTGKADWMVTQADRLYVTLGRNKRELLAPVPYTSSPNGFPYQTDRIQYFGTLNHTRTFSPTVVNEARFTAQRSNTLQFKPGAEWPTGADLGLATISDRPSGPPFLSFASGVDVGFSLNGPSDLIANTYQFNDTISWIKGRHNLRAGFNWSTYQQNMVFDFYVNGLFNFGGPDGIGSGNDFADFLFGLPDWYSQSPSAASNIRSQMWSGFIQDEWRIHPRLTLSLGLRYDYSEPKYDTQGRSFSLRYGAQSQRFTNAPVGLVFPGDEGAPRGSNHPDKNDFSPRIGIAFDPTGKGRTSIRAGFGMFYDILKAEDNFQFNGQAPFYGYTDIFPNPPASITSELSLFREPFGYTGTPHPFPSRPPASDVSFDPYLPFGGTTVYFVNPNLRTPYYYQYNLSIQHEVFTNTTAEVNYVGWNGFGLTALSDTNPYVVGTTNRIWDAQPGGQGGLSLLRTFGNVGRANYNSLQTAITRRMSSIPGVGQAEFKLAYTWGKTLDNTSGFRETNNMVPAYNRMQFWAPADFDVTHRLSFYSVWQLPFFRASGNSFLKAAFGGWQMSPIVTWHTGYPIDVKAGMSIAANRPGPSGAGDSNLVRADLVGSGVSTFDPKVDQTLANRTGNYWFDPANFSRTRLTPLNNVNTATSPAQATYGTLGRNAFRGPGFFKADVAVSKWFNIIGERLQAELRGEFFNVFNNVNFLPPNSTITSPQFGQFSDTEDPRIGQLALRIRF
ncbi:MAG TPA: TonB-dependent receptor [Bryobacteraceae bacterium]|nr:TonB-dependent receptor [Bryobacteraceae bacterium]